MKKLLLILISIVGFVTNAQQYVSVLPNNGSTSPNSRAPQGLQRYIRTCYIIAPSEITASGLPNSSVINALSFEYSVAQDVATAGTLKIYLENTSDATYTKASTNWDDVISSMTLVHNANSTIPAATGFWDITFSGGSPFTYTGGGIYVAFEYENAAGIVATTGNIALCNTAITGSLRNAFSTTVMPTALGATASAFRPATRLAFPATCISPSAVTLSSYTTSTANITFTAPASAPANGYEYYLSTSSTAPTSTTPATGTTATTSIALTSLTPASTYYVWIRSVCSASEKSIWTSAQAIHTTAVVPFDYGFENPLHPNWTILNAGTANNWGIGSTAGLSATGTSYAVYSYHTTNAANAWLFSRDIELVAGTQYTITFKVRARDTTYPESMKATIGTERTVASQTTTLWDSGASGVNYSAYTQQTGTFTPTTTGSYILGFHCYSLADQWLLLLDDISVTSALGVNENEISDKIAVYPNPVNDVLNVSNNNLYEIKSLNITDVNGRTIKKLELSNVTETHVNVSQLTSGVYFINIETNNGSITKKFIKN